jgi:hypothetical protein
VENLDDDVVISRARDTIRENITISAKESPGYYISISRGLGKDVQNYKIQGNNQTEMVTGSKPNIWG